MDLKRQFKKIDLERLILVPVFIFLLLINASGAYSHLMEHSFSDLHSTMHILHKGLVICFYLLIVALFFTRSKARATGSPLLAGTLAYAGTFTPCNPSDLMLEKGTPMDRCRRVIHRVLR